MRDLPPLGRFPGLAAAALTDEQRQALQRLQDGRGSLPAPYRFLIASPFVVDHLGSLGTALRRQGELTERELEIVVLVTAQHFQTPFVQAAHRRIGARAGLPEPVIDRLLAGQRPDLTDPHEQAVYDLAVALHRGASVPASIAADAQARLGAKAVAELIALIAVYTATCYTMRFVDAQASEAAGS